MRVGLVSWYGENYGTALQAYALYRQVERMGHACTFLTKVSVAQTLRQRLFHTLRPRWSALWQEFFNKHFQSEPVYSLGSKRTVRQHTDVFLVGSDQIWNTDFYFDPYYFLSFAGDKRRIAYAPSLGTDRVNPRYASRVRRLLSRFDFLSTREQGGQRALQSLLDRRDIQQVVDPTLLLDRSDWDLLADEAQWTAPLPERYILVYWVGQRSEYRNALSSVRAATGISDVVVISSHESGLPPIPGARVLSHVGPAEFVALIRSASLVCTDSFHATVFSLHYAKPEALFRRFDEDDPRSQNGRLTELLGRVGEDDPFYTESHPHILNFAHALSRLALCRRQSLCYLDKAIRGTQIGGASCTGCGACVAVCPHACLVMQENVYGEDLPVRDWDRCTRCGRCEQVCPIPGTTRHEPQHCFAAWNSDMPTRRKSASGGVAYLLARQVLETGGAVVATAYDADFNPTLHVVKDVTALERCKGSRYVQSVFPAEVYRQVASLLDQGQKVLVIAMPCQIAGLRGFLGHSYPNLICVDLLCHGVPSRAFFRQELAHMRRRYRLSAVDDVRFRGNDGVDFHLTLWQDNEKKLDLAGYCSYYFAGFLRGVNLRENCYTCSYATTARTGDITLGDFIGLGTQRPFAHARERVSYVSVNTELGARLYQSLQDAVPSLMSEERDMSERLSYPYSLSRPYPKDRRQPIFRSLVPRIGYVAAIRLVLGTKVQRSRFWQWLRMHNIRVI